MDEKMKSLKLAHQVLKECYEQAQKEVSAEVDAIERKEINTYNMLVKQHESSRLFRIETELFCILSLIITLGVEGL